MNDEIIFQINPSEFINIKSSKPIRQLLLYDEIKIFYNHKTEKYLINNDCIIHALNSLKEKLNLAIKNDLQLNEKFTVDIGLLWNDYLHEISKTKRNNLIYSWYGQKYILWSIENCETWLYQKDNKIILEVTPCYEWHFITRGKAKIAKGYLSYKEFIKSYKPIVLTEINHYIAKQWVKQLDEVINIINENGW